MSTPSSDEEGRRASELVASGEEFAGAAVGGALGLLGGPVGVAAGALGSALATLVFRKVGAQLRQRWLDPRQEVRVGGAFALAASRIAERIEEGEPLRSDDFFDKSATGGRTPADEVLEAMLKAAAEAHEERKVPYLATLYANIAFRDDISLPYANTLIGVAARCTWRQLVILDYLDPTPPNLAARFEQTRTVGTARPNEPRNAIWADFDGLGYEGLIGVRQSGGSVAHIAAVMDGGSFMGVRRAAPTALGNDLIELMGLREIPEADVAAVSAAVHR